MSSEVDLSAAPELQARWAEIKESMWKTNGPFNDAVRWMKLNPGVQSMVRLLNTLDKLELMVLVPVLEGPWLDRSDFGKEHVKGMALDIRDAAPHFVFLVGVSSPQQMPELIEKGRNLFYGLGGEVQYALRKLPLQKLMKSWEAFSREHHIETANGILVDPFRGGGQVVLDTDLLRIWSDFGKRKAIKNTIVLSGWRGDKELTVEKPLRAETWGKGSAILGGGRTAGVKRIWASSILQYAKSQERLLVVGVDFTESTPQMAREEILSGLGAYMIENSEKTVGGYLGVIDGNDPGASLLREGGEVWCEYDDNKIRTKGLRGYAERVSGEVSMERGAFRLQELEEEKDELDNNDWELA